MSKIDSINSVNKWKPIDKEVFKKIINETIVNSKFRESLVLDVFSTLKKFNITISNNFLADYLKNNIKASGSALIADEMSKGRVVATVGTVVSVVVAFSTPAIPKGKEQYPEDDI
ncbi:MAG: hypothetical protein AB1641_22505 [Thermodesulfobacteriota bacterium]